MVALLCRAFEWECHVEGGGHVVTHNEIYEMRRGRPFPARHSLTSKCILRLPY